MPRGLFRGGLRRDEISFQAKFFKAMNGVLWVLWTLLKNGISRLLSGVGSILGGRGWGFGTLTPSEVVSDCNVTRSRLSHPLWRVFVLGRFSGSLPLSCRRVLNDSAAALS